jgi:hypothetical protein
MQPPIRVIPGAPFFVIPSEARNLLFADGKEKAGSSRCSE